MEKTIKLKAKTSLKVSNKVKWLRIYKDAFGRDILPLLIPIANTLVEVAVSVMKATGGQAMQKDKLGDLIKELDVSDIQSALYSLAGLEMDDILKITWSMSRAADEEVEDFDTWVDNLDDCFPVDAILPVIFDLNMKMLLTTKNYSRLQEAVGILKPTNSTSTES